MHGQLKLILLYGFAGSGKSTLAKKYIDNHPMTFLLEEDMLISHIGSWLEREEEARAAVHSMMVAMVRSYLGLGNDIILPALPMDSAWLDELDAAATKCGATVHELYLYDRPDVAIQRLLDRGSWGEEGSPPITEEDRPLIEQMHHEMVRTLDARGDVTVIPIRHGNIDQNYDDLCRAIEPTV